MILPTQKKTETAPTVNALQLLWLFDILYSLSLVGWLGAILFFSFGVAPIIFKVLDSESAAKFVRALFPRYYAWLAIFSVVALASFTGRALVFPELRAWKNLIIQSVILFNILLAFYCGNSLTPAINRARDAGEAERLRFARLHKRSVMLNLVSLLAALACVVQFESRTAPATFGIVEMPVADRVEQDRQFRQTLDEVLEQRAQKARDRGQTPKPEAARPQ
ncbi:MAG: DUF4149 domain-containing protein [Planctomycetota bacterium]|nr:MAG: DUF4149 domain-containing protein [Planctomycetota bacterium]